MCEDGGGHTPAFGDLRGNLLLGINPQVDAFDYAENNMVLDQSPVGRPTIGAGDHSGREFRGPDLRDQRPPRWVAYRDW